jgi:hypothetical protein
LNGGGVQCHDPDGGADRRTHDPSHSHEFHNIANPLKRTREIARVPKRPCCSDRFKRIAGGDNEGGPQRRVAAGIRNERP